jgi:hypothetical protein
VKLCIMIALLATLPLFAQNFAPGEQRFNSAIYKSSHNSYDRDESLASQIDAFNVWQIELDIYDYSGEMKVNHNCDPGSISLASTLEELLQKMVAESVTFRNRFTIIYLDLKGNGHDGCPYSWGEQLPQRLTVAFQSKLGANKIYPSSQFIQQDGSQSPSHQELVRRGFNWAVIVDWHGPAPPNANPANLFFSVAQTDPPNPALEPPDAVLVNIDGGCNDSPTSESPGIVNSRWLYRIYPGTYGQGCSLLNGAYWQNGIAKGYNLVATNCIDDSQTFNPPLQSPDPLFVTTEAVKSCSQNYVSCEWGTVTYPFQDVAKAVQRASPMTTVLLAPGTYNVAARSPLVINHPMMLRLNGSAPVILH